MPLQSALRLFRSTLRAGPGSNNRHELGRSRMRARYLCSDGAVTSESGVSFTKVSIFAQQSYPSIKPHSLAGNHKREQSLQERSLEQNKIA